MFFKKKSSSAKETLEHRPEHSSTSPLSIHSMTVAYNQRPVLWDIEYEAPAGSLIAIVGPNGAGKTTLIKACLGLIPMAAGIVEFWGGSYKDQRIKIGYVPQRESVDWDFPISALEVVEMGRYAMIGWCKRVSKFHRDKSYSFLDKVGMADYATRQINQLSGGQQQRVFLARALAQEAELYFMDEPFAGVDAATEKAIIEILRDLRTQGKTVIAVHHDLVTVNEYYDNLLLINTRVIASGKSKEVYTPENLRSTYGGQLTLLNEISIAMARTQRGEK